MRGVLDFAQLHSPDASKEKPDIFLRYILVEAYGLNRSGVMIIRADPDSWRVASFHYSSFAARKKDIAHKLMVHFFRHCVEKEVRYMAGDGNKISILDTLWRQAEGPTNLSVIEASAWQVFVVEHKEKVVECTFIHRPHEVCVGILVQYQNDPNRKSKSFRAQGVSKATAFT